MTAPALRMIGAFDCVVCYRPVRGLRVSRRTDEDVTCNVAYPCGCLTYVREVDEGPRPKKRRTSR